MAHVGLYAASAARVYVDLVFCGFAVEPVNLFSSQPPEHFQVISLHNISLSSLLRCFIVISGVGLNVAIE